MESLKISKLQVRNFRNLEPDIIEFSPGINCILGGNGNGKTNILEAIHVLSTKKSFRKNASFPQYLSIDGESTEIYLSSVFIDEDENPMSYSALIKQNSTEYQINGRPSKKRPKISLVFINPFDSYGFHNIPSTRRQWFDTHISIMSSVYKTQLNKYNTALRFRNSLLSKKPAKFKEQINAIDVELSQYSVYLLAERNKFIKELIPFCDKIFKEVFSEEHSLEIDLESKFNNATQEDIYNILQQNLEKDIVIGHTSYGIHKDNYILLFDGLNSFDFCSLGQQKTSYLSLLFAYIKLFRYKFMSYPIVLIDDVSGELDRLRWQRLVKYLETSEFQVLITTANEKFKEELEKIKGSTKIEISSGKIIH
jgi:DNA replication and repair protein RecF